MKNTKTRYLRTLVQASIFFILIIIITVYNLYTNEMINFKILSIGDLNPYGGWSSLREFVTDSSYVFEGISKSMALTIALAAVSILGGRYFCGWLCPIGFIQDFADWLGSKAKAPKYKVSGKKGFNPLLLKYPILLSALLISILGYGAMLAELSPWRALMNLSKITSAWSETKAGFIILAGIFVVSMFISRFFCRCLCPLGAAQALFSSFSPLSLKSLRGCDLCSRCLKECPAGIRFSSESDIISPECIRCMNCIGDCNIHKDRNINLKVRDRNVPVKAYAALMLILFILIWIGMPKLWVGSSIDGNLLPSTLKDGTYQGESKGFAGKIITEVYVSEGKIADIKVIKHHESKGWYEEVFMLLPDKIIENQRLYVDGVSGATKTSKGLVKSVENAIKKAQ